MHFDDAGFSYTIYTLLKSRVGGPIKDIGDVHLSYTPSSEQAV